jgi:hypothetical protein
VATLRAQQRVKIAKAQTRWQKGLDFERKHVLAHHQTAQDLLNDMLEADLEPSVDCVSLMVDICELARDAEGAQHYAMMARDMIERAEEADVGLEGAPGSSSNSMLSFGAAGQSARWANRRQGQDSLSMILG